MSSISSSISLSSSIPTGDHLPKSLFSVCKEKVRIISPALMFYEFSNFISIATNGIDIVPVQGPPHNIMWIFRPNTSKPECLARFESPPNGQQSKHFFITAKFDLKNRWVWLVDAKAHQIFRIDHNAKVLMDSFGTAHKCGNKDGKNPLLFNPGGIAPMIDGNLMFCDYGNKSIRKYDVEKKEVTTLVTTDQDNNKFAFHAPGFIALNRDNTRVYVIDFSIIVSVILSTGKCSVLCGTRSPQGYVDAIGANARFQQLSSIAIDHTDDKLIIADSGNSAVREVTISTGRVQTITPWEPSKNNNQEKVAVEFKDPLCVDIDPISGDLLIADRAMGRALRLITTSIRGRLEFRRFALVASIRAIAYTRMISYDYKPVVRKLVLPTKTVSLKHKRLNIQIRKQAVRTLVMRTLASDIFSPKQFATLFELAPNLLYREDKVKVIRALLFSNDNDLNGSGLKFNDKSVFNL